MGTRADFYVGNPETAEWLGSIAFDGYPDGIEPELIAATTEEEFRKQVANCLVSKDDATFPSDGWPWPWADSGTTDFAYTFKDGKVYVSCFGSPLYDPSKNKNEEPPGGEIRWIDMTKVQNVQFGKRSGLTIFTVKSAALPQEDGR